MMNFLKKITPTKEALNKHKVLKIFGNFIHDPNLWHFNKKSVSKAFAVGLFFAWIPVPFQMVLAAFGAIIFNANLPLSIGLVWLTNPITMPPLFFCAYIIGTKILNTPIKPFNFKLSGEALSKLFGEVWQPFILGSLVCAIGSAIIGYFTIRIIWRFLVIKSWQRRNQQRK